MKCFVGGAAMQEKISDSSAVVVCVRYSVERVLSQSGVKSVTCVCTCVCRYVEGYFRDGPYSRAVTYHQNFIYIRKKKGKMNSREGGKDIENHQLLYINLSMK